VTRAHPLAPIAGFGRALRLYATTLRRPQFAVWLVAGLLPSINFAIAKPALGESANALAMLGTMLFCLMLSFAPLMLLKGGGMQALAFFEARPMRFPGKALIVLPLYAIAGGYAAILAAAHKLGGAQVVALVGGCAWSVDAGLLSPPRSVWRFFGWVGLLALGLLTLSTARANSGWPSAAIAMSVLAVAGWIAIPRGVVARFGGVREVFPPRGEPSPNAAARARRSGPPQPYHRRRKRTTWVDVVRTVAGGRHPIALPLLGLQGLIAGLVFAVVIKFRDGFGGAIALWMTAAMTFAGALASGLSRPTLEFLATRPLGRARLAWGTIVPWFVLTLSLPLTILAWRPGGSTQIGLERVSMASLGLRLALASVGCLFCVAHAELRPKGARASVVDVAPWAGFIAIAVPFWFPYRFLRSPWPMPPVWLIAAYAAALGVALYRRLPALLSARAALTRSAP
jgi:hypothetical protein